MTKTHVKGNGEAAHTGVSQLLQDNIDILTFEQILEMDDDENEHGFSRSLIFEFFEQAEQTFREMDVALTVKDLHGLTSLACFLKGSSAVLGLITVMESCEKVEQYGRLNDGKDTVGDFEEQKCLVNIKEILRVVKEECVICEKSFKRFYAR